MTKITSINIHIPSDDKNNNKYGGLVDGAEDYVTPPDFEFTEEDEEDAKKDVEAHMKENRW